MPVSKYAMTGAALVFGVILGAASAKAQTLSEALANTYTTNPTLLAARAELRAVNEGVPQALSGWRPNVEVAGQVGFQEEKSSGGFSSSLTDSSPTWEPQWPRQVSLTITQPVYTGGQTEAAVDSAEALVLAQRALLQDTEQTVLLAAVTAYMDVWQAQATLEFNIANEERLRRQLEATQDRFSVGEVTRTDVAQAQATLEGAVAGRIAAQGNLESAKAVFRRVIGLEPVNVGQAPPLTGLPGSQDDVVALALENEPTVVSARYMESSALADVRERLGALLPDVSLVGVLSYGEDVTFADTKTTTAQILAQVSVPIYQQGMTNSQVRQAKQVASQRRLQIGEALRQAEEEAISTYQQLLSARAQISSFQTQVTAQEIALEGMRQEYMVGARTIIDVLDSEQDLLDAQVNLVTAQRDEVVFSFQVASTIGRLTAQDLNLPVEVYNPIVDYDAVRNAWFRLSAPGAE